MSGKNFRPSTHPVQAERTCRGLNHILFNTTSPPKDWQYKKKLSLWGCTIGKTILWKKINVYTAGLKAKLISMKETRIRELTIWNHEHARYWHISMLSHSHIHIDIGTSQGWQHQLLTKIQGNVPKLLSADTKNNRINREHHKQNK